MHDFDKRIQSVANKAHLIAVIASAGELIKHVVYRLKSQQNKNAKRRIRNWKNGTTRGEISAQRAKATSGEENEDSPPHGRRIISFRYESGEGGWRKIKKKNV